jgi:hypothetical protein
MTTDEAMRFELKGESPDLEDLVRLFPTDAVTVQKIEGHYYLQLTGMESPLEENDALEVGNEALSRLNGVALLYLGNFRAPKICGIAKKDPATGSLQTHISFGGKCELRSRNSGTLQVKLPDGTIATNQSRQFSEIVIEAANENEHLSHALSVFGEESGTWRGLYKVLDAIREPHGKLENLYAKFPEFKGDIENFKHHADCYAALGADARHGFLNWEPPKNKMSLSAARNLIRGLLNAWVKKLVSGD